MRFDSLLKKAKKSVSDTELDDVDAWKIQIGSVLEKIQYLNDIHLALGEKDHYVSIRQMNCCVCGKSGFTLTTRDLHDSNSSWRFHLYNWEAIDDDSFKCPHCKSA